MNFPFFSPSFFWNLKNGFSQTNFLFEQWFYYLVLSNFWFVSVRYIIPFWHLCFQAYPISILKANLPINRQFSQYLKQHVITYKGKYTCRKKEKKLDIQQLPKLAILNTQLQNLLTFCLQLGVSEWIFVLKSLQWMASVTSLYAQCAFLADFLTKSCNM